ncbi:MAG: murein L,D-transpeptidase catalytic domain family protein [Elusimicrobiota bacterium]
MGRNAMRWAAAALAMAAAALIPGAARAEGVPAIGAGRPIMTPQAVRSTYQFKALSAHIERSFPGIPQAAVDKAIRYLKARRVDNLRYVTVIDFNKPSDQERMHVIRMQDGQVERYLVAHGSGSGMRYAEKFSNRNQTHQSSLGLYVTGGEYRGKHGRSMKLHGKEASNSNALARAIVMHGAKYVSKAYARRQGRIGRSWGCPAVDMKHIDKLVTQLKGGSVFLIHK